MRLKNWHQILGCATSWLSSSDYGSKLIMVKFGFYWPFACKGKPQSKTSVSIWVHCQILLLAPLLHKQLVFKRTDICKQNAASFPLQCPRGIATLSAETTAWVKEQVYPASVSSFCFWGNFPWALRLWVCGSLSALVLYCVEHFCPLSHTQFWSFCFPSGYAPFSFVLLSVVLKVNIMCDFRDQSRRPF